MYRLIEVGHLLTTVYWWACAIVGVTNRNIAARDSSRDAMMNMEANRENSWVGAPSFYGGKRGYASSSRGHQVRSLTVINAPPRSVGQVLRTKERSTKLYTCRRPKRLSIRFSSAKRSRSLPRRSVRDDCQNLGIARKLRLLIHMLCI